MKQIQLHKHRQPIRATFSVSDEDYEMFQQYRWTLNDNGYPRTYSGDKKIYAHHLILPVHDTLVVDHIDGDKLNCQRSNLRYVTKGTNTALGRSGVSWNNTRQRWRATVHRDKKQYTSWHRTFPEAVEGRKALWDKVYGDLTT